MLRYKPGTSKSSAAVFSYMVKLKMVTFTMSCKRGAVICNPVNTVLLFGAHHLTHSNIKLDIWIKGSTNFNAVKKVMFILVLHTLTFDFRFTMVRPFHLVSRCCEEMPHLHSYSVKKIAANLQSFSFQKSAISMQGTKCAQVFQYTRVSM
jgi:hypothetical protein